MVEAPGTAPGSATLIPSSVYRHSWFPNTLYIGSLAGFEKGLSDYRKALKIIMKAG